MSTALRRRNALAVATTVALLATFSPRGFASTFTATVPASPRFAYVSNLDDKTVNVYTIDTATGMLRPRGYTVLGGAAISVCVDPLNRFLMASTFGTANQLLSYAIDASTGALTLRDTENLSFGGPNDMAFSVNGNNLYYPNLDNSSLTHFAVSSTGVLTQTSTATTGNTPETVAVHPTKAVCYVPNYLTSNIYTFTINANGSLTELLPRVSLPANSGPIHMVVSRNGSFAYACTFDTNTIQAYTINATTGALTASGSAITHSSMTNPSSMAVNNASSRLYVCSDGSDRVTVFNINSSNGQLTHRNNYAAGTNPARIALDPSGVYCYVVNRTSNDVSIYSITQSGGNLGNLTAVGSVRTHRSPYGMAICAGANNSTPITYVPKFAYCTNQDADTLSVYTVNANTGALTAASPATIACSSQPLYAQLHPNQRILYVNPVRDLP
jgi:6-phosphogluconolactonase (cycloisomerase 2 family)